MRAVRPMRGDSAASELLGALRLLSASRAVLRGQKQGWAPDAPSKTRTGDCAVERGPSSPHHPESSTSCCKVSHRSRSGVSPLKAGCD